MVFFGSLFQLNDEEVIRGYLDDLKSNEITTEEFLTKYHIESLNDKEAKKIFTEMTQERRAFLQNNHSNDIQIRQVQSNNLPANLLGLKWQSGIYTVYLNGEYFIPILVQEGEVKSTIIMSKGKRKYFLYF